MFQAALTSRAFGMHQRVIVTEGESLSPPPVRGKRTTLRDIIEARESVVVEEKKYGPGVIVTYKRPYNEFWVKVEGYNDVIKLSQGESGAITSFGRHPSGASWQAFQVVKKFIKAGYPTIKPHGQWPEKKVNEEKQLRGTVKPGSAKPGSGKPGEYAGKGKFQMKESGCTGNSDCGCGCKERAMGKFTMEEIIEGIEVATELDDAEPQLESGERFEKLTKKLASRHGRTRTGKSREVSDPKALAAFIGRKKYGKAKFQKMAAKGR